MADAMEPVWKHMDQETADELGCSQPYHLLAFSILDTIVFPSDRNRIGIDANDATVRDGDAVRVTAEISQHSLGATEGWFGVNDLFLLRSGAKYAAKACGSDSPAKSPKKLSSPSQCRASNPSINKRRNSRDKTRTCRKNPSLHATRRLPSFDKPPPGTVMWT